MAGLINAEPWSKTLESSLSTLSPSLSKTTVLQTLRLIKTPVKALHFFNWTHQHNFSHTHQSYFLMLEILGRNRNLNSARNFLYSIPKRSNGAVHLQDKSNMVDEGFPFFKEMERFRCDPVVITYNTLVDGLCRGGKVKIAHNVIKGQGLKPNSITYNTIIHGLCEAGKLDKVKEILEGMVGGGDFVPDTCTFNTFINAHCDAGNFNEGLKAFEKMSKLGVIPDSATYSVLIRSLCQKRDFVRAEELFDELAQKDILLDDAGCRPLVAAYNPFFEYLCRDGRSKKAERVFRQLMKRGVQDPSSYKTLIIGHCREGNFEAGHDLLVLMLRRDFVPDLEMYESLVDGLMLKGDPNLAQDTLAKMLKSSHLPRTATFHSILTALVEKGFARESARLVMLMLERSIRQNINLSTDTSRKLIDAREMLLFSLEKDHTVDADVCSTVIAGLCKACRVSEAFGFYYELLDKGIQKPLSCLKDLRNSLEAEGRSKEAEFVARRMPK
ncbi:hypothetical protein RJ639_016522 [Escallonia herrerae]|uniref:Pentatricopeptide repeat-containing protein n=1 Tax=Escallonia herrerae TaxID=1293975 RepID=A0AA88VEP0_9ASTE|nr:hypothetical protein RJ639_016522 [Escallonia herrerae]